MNKENRIYIAGHTGLVGSALVRTLQSQGYTNLYMQDFAVLDLRNQQAVNNFFEFTQPQYVFLAAAKVGGIHANNTYRAEFIYDNLMITSNIIHAAYQYGVKKLLFLGSSCIYPRLCPQPIKEEYLLTGPLEPTNQPYALAKIAGIELCSSYRHQYGCNFISAMPTNLYGPGDTFHAQHSHVIPSLIKKMYEAHLNKESSCTIWGSGKPLREFLFVDDLAEALIFLMHHYDQAPPINVGSGHEVSISQLAELIRQAIGYEGTLYFDTSMPDGTPRKLVDCTRLNTLGWQARISLQEGIRKTIEWYKKDIMSNNNLSYLKSKLSLIEVKN